MIKFWLPLMALLLLTACPAKEPLKTGTVAEAIAANQATSETAAATPLTLDKLAQHIQSKGLKIIENDLNAANYYAALTVTGENIPTAAGRCDKPSPLYYGLKALFGIDDSNEFLVSANVSSRGEDIVKNFPLLLVAHYDEGEDGYPQCVTRLYSQNITDYYRGDAGLSFDVQYTISRRNSKDVNTVSRLFDLTRRIATVSTPTGYAVTKLTGDEINSVAKDIDFALTAGFSIASSDSASGMVPKYEIGSDITDGFRLNLGRIADGAKGSSLTVRFTYKHSMLGRYNNAKKKTEYPSEPTTLLSLATGFGMNISGLVNNNQIPGVTRNDLISYSSGADQPRMSAACQSIKQYFSTDLPLSEDDQLVLRWAILKLFSQYDRNTDIRSEQCLANVDQFEPLNSEAQRLQRLNKRFYFVDTDFKKKQFRSKLKALVQKMSARARDLFDPQGFSLTSFNEDILPATEEEGLWNDYGELGVNKLFKMVETPTCMQAAVEEGVRNPHIVAVNFYMLDRQQRRNKPAAGYYNNKGRAIIPAVIMYDPDISGRRSKIQAVITDTYDKLRNKFSIPSTWPSQQDSGNCLHLQQVEASSVKVAEVQ